MTLAERNPFRCRGTELPVPLLVMAKAIAICTLLHLYPQFIPSPFLPFWSPIDWIERALPEAIRLVLILSYAGSAAALLLNWHVRAASFLLGVTILLALLGNRVFFSNTLTFVAAMLILTGLYHPRSGPVLVRSQVVIVYFGAALHKVLDPDWRDGSFFENWMGTEVRNTAYIWLSSLLPEMAFARLVSWATIALEFVLVGFFLVRRLWPAAIWISLIFHCVITLSTGERFYFFYGIQAAMLAFVAWPQRLLVIYDGDCGICNRIRRFWQRIDFDRLFTWQPLQSDVGATFGLPKATLAESLHFVAGDTVTRGFRACKRMLQYHPATWLTLAALIAMPRLADNAYYRAAIILGALAFFLPVTEPAGERVYRWVARNRYRFSSKSTCAVDLPSSR
jgi:predicted DCC family thiol-disulfide oxidoreductase YuxK